MVETLGIEANIEGLNGAFRGYGFRRLDSGYGGHGDSEECLVEAIDMAFVRP